jgi:hypothetical protein
MWSTVILPQYGISMTSIWWVYPYVIIYWLQYITFALQRVQNANQQSSRRLGSKQHCESISDHVSSTDLKGLMQLTLAFSSIGMSMAGTIAGIVSSQRPRCTNHHTHLGLLRHRQMGLRCIPAVVSVLLSCFCRLYLTTLFSRDTLRRLTSS